LNSAWLPGHSFPAAGPIHFLASPVSLARIFHHQIELVKIRKESRKCPNSLSRRVELCLSRHKCFHQQMPCFTSMFVEFQPGFNLQLAINTAVKGLHLGRNSIISCMDDLRIIEKHCQYKEQVIPVSGPKNMILKVCC
jgi:hypothetical protein